MSTFIIFRKRIWRLVCGAAVAMAVAVPTYFNWIHPKQDSLEKQLIGFTSSPKDTATSISITTPAPDPATSRAEEIKIKPANPFDGIYTSGGIDPEKVYMDLMWSSSEEVAPAIETVLQRAEAFYPFNAVYRRVVQLSLDADPQVAERAMQARNRLIALRIAHKIPDPHDPQMDETQDNAPGVSVPHDLLETAVIPFDTFQGLALDDPDPGVRLGGIETALSQSDTDCFNLLYEAAQRDLDPDNRLSTLSELEHMLKSGLGNEGQALQLLEKSAADPDPRVAQLSKLILQGQLGVELLDGSEMWMSDEDSSQETTVDGIHQSADIMETTEASFEDIQEQALYDSDPSVRLGGIEAALSQEKEERYWLLADAARNDYDPDNRLSAVSMLEQMLKSGLGNGDQILQLLKDASSDPDPRVAELSSLIIQERLEAQEKPFQL